MTRRIAILKPSALGDIVHALPVLSALRELEPQAEISWVVNRGFQDLLDGHPDLDRVLPFDRGAFHKGLWSSVNYAHQFQNLLRRERLDLVLDLQGLMRTGLMALATGARRRIGFANAREGSHWAYTERVAVPDADSIHAVDRYWKVIEHLGGGHLVKRFQVPLAPGPMQQARDLLAPFPSPYVAVAVGAKWLTKRWPPEHFAELLRRMYDLTGGTVVLLGAPDDIPLSATTSRSLCGPVLDLTGKTSLPLLAAVLKTCQVMLANDTGPLHLAAALGLPCVAPYTCTKIALHGPYLGPYARATQVACAGSYLKRCPNQMICMSDLTPDHLWPAFHEVLVTCR